MKEKKYLILGGNGFIGRNLCDYLSAHGISVTSFDKMLPKDTNERVQYVQGDFFDDDSLRKIVMQQDVIYHAISTIIPGNSNEKYMSGYGQDMVQTIKMCSWIKDTDKTLIFLSSGGTVYGEQKVQPIREETLPLPINHYGNVKLCIENALRIFHIQNKMKVRIARIANPYGPGQDYTKGVGFVDAALKRTLENKDVEIWGGGQVVRDYIYIGDVCYYLYKLACYEGEEIVFNVSSGKGISQKQVIEAINNLGKKVKTVYKETRSIDVSTIILDNNKILNACGGEITSFEAGLKLYYEYLS